MLKSENHSLKALILVTHAFINGIWKFRVGLMGPGGKWWKRGFSGKQMPQLVLCTSQNK